VSAVREVVDGADALTPGDHSAHVFWPAMFVFAFILAPLFVVVGISFTASVHITFPPEGFSLRWYRVVLTESDWVGALVNSTIAGALVAVTSAIVGTAGALAIHRGNFKHEMPIYLFLLSPMMIPRIVLAIGIFNLFLALQLTGSFLGITLGLATITIPYTVITVSASLSTLSESVVEAARVHGANSRRAFARVIVPNILPGILSGAIFSFIIAWNDYIIAVYISGSKTLLPITIFNSLRVRVSPAIGAIGTLVIAIGFGMTLLVIQIDERYDFV